MGKSFDPQLEEMDTFARLHGMDRFTPQARSDVVISHYVQHVGTSHANKIDSHTKYYNIMSYRLY